MSLVVSQPSTVDSLIEAALEGGASTLKPPAESFWGYGGVVRAPDGVIWTVATSRSFGSKYVEFESPAGPVKPALYGRRALANQAGVSPDGTGSHRLVVGSDAGPFTPGRGFAREAASVGARAA